MFVWEGAGAEGRCLKDRMVRVQRRGLSEGL